MEPTNTLYMTDTEALATLVYGFISEPPRWGDSGVNKLYYGVTAEKLYDLFIDYSCGEYPSHIMPKDPAHLARVFLQYDAAARAVRHGRIVYYLRSEHDLI